jgi:hypothetical protein
MSQYNKEFRLAEALIEEGKTGEAKKNSARFAKPGNN